jgi:LysR family transcriptional regulator, glycine cleavage system transcriptional activator
MDELPPLNALRVFEAAGRLNSFNVAAEELHLTPSAVSHAIRSLEDWLGVALFERQGRGVVLTTDGRIFLAPVHDALTQVGVAADKLRRQSINQPLNISAAPALTTGWLMPRLGRFQLMYPDIEVRLSSSAELVDLNRSDFDMAIRSGSGHWSGMASHFLMSEELVPACKPSLAAEDGNVWLADPSDLRHVPLIHIMPTMGQWRSWLNAQAVDHPDPDKGPKFESSAVAVEAAVAGLGVVVVPRSFVAEHVSSGRLVLPFDNIKSPGHYDFYVVYPTEHADVPRIAAFRDWLLEEDTNRARVSA